MFHAMPQLGSSPSSCNLLTTQIDCGDRDPDYASVPEAFPKQYEKKMDRTLMHIDNGRVSTHIVATTVARPLRIRSPRNRFPRTSSLGRTPNPSSGLLEMSTVSKKQSRLKCGPFCPQGVELERVAAELNATATDLRKREQERWCSYSCIYLSHRCPWHGR